MLALETFAELVAEVPAWAEADGLDTEYAKALTTFLGLCVGKLAQTCSMQVRLFIDSRNGAATALPAFSRPDISPLWDFMEVNPFGGSVGDWMQIVETALRAVPHAVPDAHPAQVEKRDARTAGNLVEPHSALVATDPPYFSNFGYADPSNYFYIWLRLALRNTHPLLFSTLGAPSTGELIADPSRHDENMEAAKTYFIEGLTETMGALIRASRPDLPILVVYAFKQQEVREGEVVSTGWDAILQALIGAGLMVTGTWPIHGTRSVRARSLSSNALATYVLLVCRPRPLDAGVATRRQFLAALRTELPKALEQLRQGNVAPVDLPQSAIGPGMRVFSRYSRVIEADGNAMPVRIALGLINSILYEVQAASAAEFDAETRWAMTWFEQYGTSEGKFGEAETMFKALNTSERALHEARVAEARGGRVRLLGRDDLPAEWDPLAAHRVTIWGMTQALISTLDKAGEAGAAALLRRADAFSDAVRDLAYALYMISERKGWSEEGLAYNGLAAAWPEITRLAASSGASQVALRLE